MKTNLVLTSIAAILLSVAGANATEYRPFVGITLGVSDIAYSKTIDRQTNIDTPSDLFTFGIEGGFRFGGYNQIYNGGVSLNIDTTDSEKIRDKFTDQAYAKLKMSSISATYDNYIRLSGDKTSRIDLVLGVGLGEMNYNIDYKNAGLDDTTVYSSTFAFKLGLDFELTKNVTLSLQSRAFTPTRSHYSVDAQYVFGGAVKYVF